MKYLASIKFGYTIGIMLVLFGIAYFYKNTIEEYGPTQQLINEIRPCTVPVTYSLGRFDSRFNISQTEFLQALDQAEKVWEIFPERNLFRQTDNGNLKINLIYDARQEATIKLQQLGLTITGDKTSYNLLQTNYASLQGIYLKQKNQLDSQLASFNKRKAKYESDVSYWNKQGGAPAAEYKRLNQEKAALSSEVNIINQTQGALNRTVDSLNTMATVLNRQAQELNLNVEKYNTIGRQTGEEFEEGEYVRDMDGTRINIYQFENKAKLVRVLAHELGHALGLDHIDDSKAIMYRLNQSKNEDLAPSDISALQKFCNIN